MMRSYKPNNADIFQNGIQLNHGFKMKYTDIKFLFESEKLKCFCMDFNFHKFYYENKIYLFSPCLVISIYALQTEETIYIDVFSENLKLNSTASRLLSKKESNKINTILEKYEIHNLFNDLPKRDKKLYQYLDLMTNLLSDFLNCKNFEAYTDVFEVTFEPIEKEVRVAKSIFKKSRRSFLLDGD